MKKINTMEKEFIPYELAVKLKELGFNEECFNIYFKTSKNLSKLDGKLHKNYYREGVTCSGITAPLWQQAFDWFRVNHRHYSNVVPNPTSYIKHQNCDWLFGYNIINSDNPMFDLRYKTYEEARLACLNKLIELVENKEYNARN